MALARRINRIAAVVCILVPAGAMMSIGCGLFSLPVTGPKALVTNARSLRFTVDIVDDAGVPLKGVTVQARRYALDANLFIGETDKVKSDPKRVVDGTLDYNDFGDYAVRITFSKAGYQPVSATYSTTDQVQHAPTWLFGPQGAETENCINIQKNPKQRVVLAKQAGPAM